MTGSARRGALAIAVGAALVLCVGLLNVLGPNAVGLTALGMTSRADAAPSSVMMASASAAAESLEMLKAKYRRPAAPVFPDTNPYSQAKADLGKHLFFDPRLSHTGSVSCASCHNPALRWSDGLARGIGVTATPLPRRSPSIINAAWLTALMWDGRAASLEQQAMMPMTAEHEMGTTLDEAAARIAAIPGYPEKFARAFPGGGVTAEHIVAAIATYERTLVSNQAPFDRWIAGEESAISEDAKRGFSLFNGAARCSKCHSSWRFTDDSFHDIGLKSTDIGRGQFAPPSVVIMQHAFKTPTLRDMSIVGPYMHDGSMTLIEQVLEHYEKGGITRPSLSPEMKSVKLTAQDRADLIAFLKTLSAPPAEIQIPVLP